MSTHVFTITAAEVGERLDRWLAAALPTHSRSEIQRWVREGLVQVDGVVAKANHRLEAGEFVQVQAPVPKVAHGLRGEPIPLSIVYEDADLLVIDKPAGLVVHPAPGHDQGTLVNAVLHHCPEIEGVGGERRPGIVHRLDKETSGLLVVAKNERAHRHLQAQFQARTVEKEYLALVEGQVEPPTGRMVAPLGRHPTDRQRQAVLPPDPMTGVARGRSAITDYHTLRVYHAAVRDGSGIARFTLLRVWPHTGRTHQIRVHFAWRKHPIVGDVLYGYKRQRLPVERQFLHAHRLQFQLPSSGEIRTFVAPLPADLQRVLDALEQG
jgi:23S rRNA pseudouridine1911/1915/1917 synthase